LFNKGHIQLYCSNRVWDVLHLLLDRNSVSDLPTLKPNKKLSYRRETALQPV